MGGRALRAAGAAAALLLPLLLPVLASAQTAPSVPAAQPACRPDPLQGRALYLRGSFNSWAAADAQRFTWACRRWELVTRIDGEHRFKVGDEAWSADADFGGATPAALRLLPRGAELIRRFDGVHRFTLTMNDDDSPDLRIETCPVPAPLGDSVLFLRGTLNNWAALDDYAFQYSCDAYYLNLKASGRHEFKIADAAWTEAATVTDRGGANFVRSFSGEHTLRLVFAGGQPQLSVGPRTFADPSARRVTDPLALSLRFDSRALAYKSPFGAITPGTEVSFMLEALPGVEALTLVVERRRLEGNQELLAYEQPLRLPMQAAPPAAGRQRWTARHRYAEVGVFGYWFEARIAGQLFVLQNNAEPVHWTREKGAGGAGVVADKPQATGSIRRFRQTVHAADFTVPGWAADAVYYFVFPDRFRNGDARNDPQPGVARYQNHGIEFHRDWLQRPYRPGSGDGSDAVYNNDFFGGDLAGLVDKLDHIQALGANVIYMTPIFTAASNHKYDTADYRQVDPAFGSNADFTRLSTEAGKRGIRVLVDTSLNHTGSDSVYFNRYGNFGTQGAFQGGHVNPASPYAGWYSFDTAQTEADRQFKGWVGIKDLPELDKTSPALRDFFYRAPDAVMKLWLDRGAAGWRMDVVPWVPDDFWREWRAAIKAHRPDAITVAETWFDASKYFLGDMFDSTMNYVFRNAVLDYAAGGSAQALALQLEHLREAYPPQAHQALMNLLSSHDQARALHVLGWREGGPDSAAARLAKQRLRLATLFQMSYPGAPAVYYGDEVGVTGGDDPDNRATFPWPDLGGQPDEALHAEFRRLIALRHAHPVLRRGSLLAPLHADEQVLVLARRLGDSWALTGTNNGAQPVHVTVDLPAGSATRWRELLTGGEAVAAGGRVSLTLPPRFGGIWVGAQPGK